MPEYREIAPPADRAHMVECLWTMRSGPGGLFHRVTPDGCADILFTNSRGRVRLEAVGPMTAWRDFAIPAGTHLTGIRLRPGMWHRYFQIPGDRLTDAILSLEDLWGPRARSLAHRLSEIPTPSETLALLCPPPESPDPAQQAIALLATRHGCISLDELASAAGLSPRQFRRTCLQFTGLTPKLLARVLRFRRAFTAAHSRRIDCAALAADCGYYDQPHLIREFHEFAGRTPMAVLSNSPAMRSATIDT